LKINWIIPVNHTDYNRMPASVWIRCLQLIPYLAKAGVHSEINNPDSEASTVVFVRNQSLESRALAKRFRDRGKKIVFDLCVNYFDRSTLKNLGSPVQDKHIEECLGMLEMTDCVTCASSNIAERARMFHPNVHYLPDSVDLSHFNRLKTPDDFLRGQLCAIWSGQWDKAVELRPILGDLKKRNIRLKLITNKQFRLSSHWGLLRYSYDYVKWRYETFPDEILGGEICVSYRETDTPYNRGHSFFKIGTFLAQGVPCLASEVPSYVELLADGYCGCICRTREEWNNALDMLMEDRSVLQRWSANAIERMRQYSTENVAARYDTLFKSLTQGGN